MAFKTASFFLLSLFLAGSSSPLSSTNDQEPEHSAVILATCVDKKDIAQNCINLVEDQVKCGCKDKFFSGLTQKKSFLFFKLEGEAKEAAAKDWQKVLLPQIKASIGEEWQLGEVELLRDAGKAFENNYRLHFHNTKGSDFAAVLQF